MKEHPVRKLSLEELLNKAKTTFSIADDCKDWDNADTPYWNLEWISKKDVVEFFKTRVVVDRKQFMDDLEGLIQDLEDASWRPCPEANIKYVDMDEVKSLLKQFFGEASSQKGSVEA